MERKKFLFITKFQDFSASKKSGSIRVRHAVSLACCKSGACAGPPTGGRDINYQLPSQRTEKRSGTAHHRVTDHLRPGCLALTFIAARYSNGSSKERIARCVVVAPKAPQANCCSSNPKSKRHPWPAKRRAYGKCVEVDPATGKIAVFADNSAKEKEKQDAA